MSSEGITAPKWALATEAVVKRAAQQLSNISLGDLRIFLLLWISL
jgi:hypothetical protein